VGAVLPAASAVAALVDLSPGGALMQSGQSGDGLVERCPDDVQRELAALHSSLAELLRHFWACFPPTSPQLQEKVVKMHETLQKFQQVRKARTRATLDLYGRLVYSGRDL